MTAYWVVYVNDELAKKMEKIDLFQYQQIEKREAGKLSHHDEYSEIIPAQIRMLVSDENTKQGNEIMEYQTQQQIKALQKLYEERYNEYEQVIQSVGQLPYPHPAQG